MKWKAPEWQRREKDKTSDSDVVKFLKGEHRGKKEFPDSTLFIGTGYEIGGAYEDWGFGVFKLIDGKLTEISSAKTLDSAIAQARMRLQAELEERKKADERN